MGKMHLRRILVLLYDFLFLRKMAELYGNIGQSSFFLIWAIITGLVTGGAVVLIRLIAVALEALTGISVHGLLPAILLILAPVFGLALSWFIKKTLSHSNSSADMTLLIRSIRERKPELIRLETLSHVIASPLTAGLGASAGLTTPSVLTGASTGANIGHFLHMAPERTVQLMTCGTAAGIAAIFGSPIAGVLFAVEVLLPKMSVGELVPVLLSAAGATVVVQVALSNTPFFEMLCQSWDFRALPFYVILGLLSAAIGIGMIRGNRWVSGALDRYCRRDVTRLLVGGVLVAALVALFPRLAGEGIAPMQMLIRDHSFASSTPGWLRNLCGDGLPLMILTGLLLFLLKIAATSLTLSCGGSGGFFAPSLFVGAFFGFTMKHVFELFRWGSIHDTNFIALGMCGVFASSFRAPLTAIFLVVEMSGSYVLMIPLILVAALSYFITAFFEDDSIYTTASAVERAGRGMHLKASYRRVIRTEYTALLPGRRVNWEILLASTAETVFPVLDSSGYLLGIIPRAKIENIVMLNQLQTPPEKLMIFPKVVLRGNEKLSLIFSAMHFYGMNFLPVLDGRRRFKGFVSVETG